MLWKFLLLEVSRHKTNLLLRMPKRRIDHTRVHKSNLFLDTFHNNLIERVLQAQFIFRIQLRHWIVCRNKILTIHMSRRYKWTSIFEDILQHWKVLHYKGYNHLNLLRSYMCIIEVYYFQSRIMWEIDLLVKLHLQLQIIDFKSLCRWLFWFSPYFHITI